MSKANERHERIVRRDETDAAWDSAEHNARRAERAEAEVVRLRNDHHYACHVADKLREDVLELRKCCAQRGARMQIMREWMHNFEAGSLWTGSVWDALAEIRNADTWFNHDGVPVDVAINATTRKQNEH